MPKLNTSLNKSRKRSFVRGEGNRNAKIVIVGEAPGKDEVRKGRLFVGESGRILNLVLQKAGINRYQCYITNVVKERPKNNNIGLFYLDKSNHKPKKELLAYREQVRKEVQAIKPNVIIALGAEPTKTFLHDNNVKISKYRGSIFDTKYGKVIPTFHPAYIMRRWAYNPIIIFDLIRAKEESKFRMFKPTKRNLMVEPTFTEIEQYLDHANNQEKIAFDIEQYKGKKWFIDCLSIATSKSESMSIPLTYPDGAPYWSLDEEMKIQLMLAKLMANWGVKKIAQNAKYDVTFMELNNIPVNNLWFDTMNAANLINPEYPKGLYFLTSIYTREPYYKDTIDSDRWLYNAKDSAVTFEVHEGQLFDLQEMKVKDFYFNHVHPLINIFIEVSKFGLCVDDKKLKSIEKKIENDIESMKERIKELTGEDINVYSVKDMRNYIYGKLGLKKKYNKNDNLDTSAQVLEDFYRNTGREELNLFMKLRALRSRKSTYLNAERSEDGRIRTSYDPAGTKQGRLNSRKFVDGTGMNLQNVTKNYRDLFIPDEGFVFVGADYGQAENRAVAYFSEDQKMIDTVEGDGDVHTNNAALIFNIPKEEVTKERRQMGKRITHGSNYRMGVLTFARHADVSTAEARILLRKYHETYTKVRVWHKEIEQELKKTRQLVNPFGRVRRFPDRLNSPTFNSATSFLPQSTVADLINRSIIKIHARLPHPARLMLQLHDALTVQCLPEQVEEVKNIIEEEMNKPVNINNHSVIIPAKAEVGHNWKEMP